MLNNKIRKQNTVGKNQAGLPDLGFLEFLGEGVMVLDSNRNIIMVNSALENLLGWSAAELTGQTCFKFFDCQHPGTGTSLCHNLCPLMFLRTISNSRQGIYYQEISMITREGQRREVSASFAPLVLPSFPGQPVSVTPEQPGSLLPEYSIIMLRDVTEIKRQERIKTEFIAAASHQLRTPLSSIKTSIGLLLENVGEDFSPPLKRLLNNIQSSSTRMERLVNDLIELTSLQSGRVQMQRRRFEARELVGRAITLNQEKLESRVQTIEWSLPDEPLYVEADFGRMSQVLGHLISNASKFSGYGKNINIDVAASTRERSQEVIFSVIDEGVGIEETEKGLIFEKFYQSQISENANETGNGLGLPLARALIELNGGRLWFESQLGKGSSFYFALPLAPTGLGNQPPQDPKLPKRTGVMKIVASRKDKL
jgi:PAS domain S-box-containing protein